MTEPGWKLLLNYGAILMFLTLPVIVMILQLYALHNPTFLTKELPQEEFHHLLEFQRALAALVFGLAGLRTWEIVKNGKNGNHTESRTVKET